MNDIIPANFGGQVSSRFQGREVGSLSEGIQGGFGMIGYRGKVWSTRHRGEERQLMRADGDGPVGSIEVVIIKSPAAVSKVWYAEAWADGSTAAPDCFSTNGIVPDNSVDPSKRQAHACANCPKNAWGSQIKADGTAGKGKACSDSKRLAVVPLNDLKNDFLGGPMMLRVPAASLQDLATYGDALQKMGFPYCAVGTRISFDTKESYPKFVFGAIRPLNDAEADIVLAHLEDPVVDRILAEIVEQAQPAPQQPAPVAFEQPPAAQQAVPPAQPAPAAPPPPAAQVAVSGGGFGASAPPPPPPATAPAQAQTAARARSRKPAAAKPAPETQPTPPPQPAPPAPAQAGGFGASEPVTLQGNGAAPAPSQPATPSDAEAAFDAELDALIGGDAA